MLLEGKLNAEESKFEGKRAWEVGRLIDLR